MVTLSADQLDGSVGGAEMEMLIVVVRYRISLEDSVTFVSLSKAFMTHPDLLASIGVLIWDNGPTELQEVQLPFPFEYRYTGRNVGVSAAYNCALALAEEKDCPWLLLLDQDTTIPEGFLARMLEYARSHLANRTIAAVAPFLICDSQPVSPAIIRVDHAQPLPLRVSGEHERPAYAANSGTLMRVSALRAVGGYDEDFWLDYSDIALFHRLYLHGTRLYVAGDLHLHHSLSTNNYDETMSPERYRNAIAAEGAYWDLYRSRRDNFALTARLLLRAFKQWIVYRNKEFSKITWRQFFRRIFATKPQRLQHWRRQAGYRNIPAVASENSII
jgi:GT2 family glycosyltransferase